MPLFAPTATRHSVPFQALIRNFAHESIELTPLSSKAKLIDLSAKEYTKHEVNGRKRKFPQVYKTIFLNLAALKGLLKQGRRVIEKHGLNFY